MPRILLHIGAHKTATSYMQKKLALNVDLLARRGIHYDPLEVFRKGFTPLPYKLVTIASGFAHYSFAMFMILSVITRGGRYFLVAGLLYWKGEQARRFRFHRNVERAGIIELEPHRLGWNVEWA